MPPFWVQELHYILHIDNIVSVLQDGLLSHRRAQQHPHRSVADADVQARRVDVIVPSARRLHEYVNLYINGRNAMLYKITCNQDINDICILRVDASVMDQDGVAISDRNAACYEARFITVDEVDTVLRKERIFAKYWIHDNDPIETDRHKAEMMAEVLVPDTVSSVNIMGAYVATEEAKKRFISLAPGLNIMIDGSKFV